MKKYYVTVAVITITFTACNNAPKDDSEATQRKNGYTTQLKTKEDSLYHDIMQGHDTAMAKTGKLRRYLDETQRMLDTIQKLPAKKINALYLQQLQQLKQQLADANNAMNDWMDNFKIDSAKGNIELRNRYLQSEKEKVDSMKLKVLNSTRMGDSLLKKF